ncbi:IclR family transcriptional regulator [Herbiconiux daphne]|uniref:IclR family transcriptional regulator n=1 Tax=Herbiconiux daphne TaxID=2970914 RepID=A0ABT2H832_9MICO|nr:IclR family transcriptional regulator [Herbiconiux daphne]MCS5736084.1 IclR family transcriptional regulator [Herbiconiux daphne]
MSETRTDAADDVEAGPDAIEARRRQPLARGIELLTLMVDSDQDTHGVRELAGRLGISPSTVHRLITDLEKLGLVSRTPAGAYRLGLEFLRLAWTTSNRFPLQELASDTLDDLTEQTGESSFFGVYNEQRRQMMFTLTVESPHPLRYTLPVREWLPLHAGASGIAILAFVPEAVQQAVITAPLAAQTDRTLVDAESLTARLAAVREEGYAITHGERIEGAIAIAAPVFGPSGVVGVTGVSLPESRFNAAHSTSLATLVRQSAARLSGYISGTRNGDNDATHA